uniref:Predicted protein n=1 Tax=Hordeum vulgare subsp. vulgare TaxID=112509 RepID=F2E6G2_HORVV|nr:predicted protein [Hordeum vulgare subsp. vulgare]
MRVVLLYCATGFGPFTFFIRFLRFSIFRK